MTTISETPRQANNGACNVFGHIFLRIHTIHVIPSIQAIPRGVIVASIFSANFRQTQLPWFRPQSLHPTACQDPCL